jgi:hypothetical protein
MTVARSMGCDGLRIATVPAFRSRALAPVGMTSFAGCRSACCRRK